MGYTDPTPIQLRGIPAVLSGKDIIGSAQTGTGKTAAFALPILTRLGAHNPRTPRVLVLEPTRELAAQVDSAFRDFSRFGDVRSVVLHGGVGYGHQRSELRRGVDIIVATPGRLIDYLDSGEVRLDGLEILVLDEVDRMLDMGFLPAVKKIIQRCPKKRQTLFFSATVPPEIAEVARFTLVDPVRIEIGASRTVTETISHAIYPVAAGQKFELLEALLERTDFNSILVFSRTKHGADRIARRLKHSNHSVAVLHSNRSQNQRIEALAGFKNGKYEVMVATDIAARGIDVAGISHVINYDVPANPEDYVHRIGRTGRAMAVGDAFTLASPENADDVRAIERFIGQKIPQLKLEGFNYQPIVMGPPKPPQQRGGGRQGGGHGGGQRSRGHSGGGQSSNRGHSDRGPQSSGQSGSAPAPRAAAAPQPRRSRLSRGR
ncbi:MAG TPA: DEAD/DEAH box helicase [Opitutaceae bacterium]|nr:DEAD/DEAH box helicase [Opitutaceae bacterium]